MDRVINWSESVRLHFGDVTLPELLPAWNDLKLHLPVGSKVSGPVVLKAPFGVWLDLGVRFPAMLLIPDSRTASLTTTTSSMDLNQAITWMRLSTYSTT